jgi:hypothetical protein
MLAVKRRAVGHFGHLTPEVEMFDVFGKQIINVRETKNLYGYGSPCGEEDLQ